MRLVWLLFAVIALALVLHPILLGWARAQPGAQCRTYAAYAWTFAQFRDVGARVDQVTREISTWKLELGQSHEQLQAEARRVFRDRRPRLEAAEDAYARCIQVLGHFPKPS